MYQPTLWSYGLFHNAVPAAREFLQHADALVGRVRRADRQPAADDRSGGPASVPAPGIQAAGERPRHALGKRRQIVNDRFHEQYHQLPQDCSRYHRGSTTTTCWP